MLIVGRCVGFADKLLLSYLDEVIFRCVIDFVNCRTVCAPQVEQSVAARFEIDDDVGARGELSSEGFVIELRNIPVFQLTE